MLIFLPSPMLHVPSRSYVLTETDRVRECKRCSVNGACFPVLNLSTPCVENSDEDRYLLYQLDDY